MLSPAYIMARNEGLSLKLSKKGEQARRGEFEVKYQ